MSRNFYTARLMGGLGNQMFQIANAIAQGLKNNVDVIIPNYSFTPNQGRQIIFYEKNIFKNIPFGIIRQKTHKVFEKSWNDSFLEYNKNDNIEFNGYFQGSRNFLEYENEIKKLFLPSEKDLNKIFKKYTTFEKEKKVSIHIRRGDYLKYPDVHGVVDMSYVEYCLSVIEPYDKIYVFSDDKNWVRENFHNDKSVVVEDLEDYEELWMMSVCDINIMSCSSFSWWSSYLNQKKEKKIFVPNKWFGPSGPKEYENIFEKDWIKVNVKYQEGFLFYEEN